MKVSKRKVKNAKRVFSIILAIILLVAIYINTYLIIKYNVLPIKYLLVYFILVILLPIIYIYLSVFQRLKKIFRKIIYVIEIFYIILLLILFFYLNKTFNFLNAFTSKYDYETKNYYVLVQNNSKYDDITDLENHKIGFAKNLDTSIDKAMNELDNKVKLNHEELSGYSELFESLKNEEVDGVLIIDTIYNMLTEDDDELKNSNKILFRLAIKEKISNISKDVDVTEETFNVYISGMDSYGSVTDKTRSDVNIIMSVNPKTHKLLMINIPRDYYVNLAGINEMDKLTHAGIYGVETSIKTIEALLGIDINYYIKVNYNALIGLVNALDGVEVYSEYNFYSSEFNYKFVKGYNKVNGKMALDFVRTRYAFVNGDRVRGENQQRMIQAIINKANNPKVLLKYDEILKSLEGSFTTNISTEKIMSLVNMQLDKMPTWSMEAISLNGKDSSAITYSFKAQELYVMIPNEETIESARAAILELQENG